MSRSRFIVCFLLACITGALVGCNSVGSNPTDAKGLFNKFCAKCHAQAGEPGGPDIGGSRGPNLSKIGAVTGHTVEYFAEYIREPKSKKPDAKMMPAFGDKLTSDEIHKLAEYLTTLK
jgi:mono/diheme cytochrome c family protein